MGLRLNYMARDGRESPSAYVKVIDFRQQWTPLEPRIWLLVGIWHDQEARERGLPPIETREYAYFERPNIPSSLWDQLDGATEEQRNAALEAQLGKNWLLEHPRIEDLFSQKALEDWHPAALWYTWAAQYDRTFKDAESV